MKQKDDKIVGQHVSFKLTDLIMAIDNCINDHMMWTVGKRHAQQLMTLGRYLRVLKFRMIDGQADGKRYQSLSERVRKMSKDLRETLSHLSRLYKRMLED